MDEKDGDVGYKENTCEIIIDFLGKQPDHDSKRSIMRDMEIPNMNKELKPKFCFDKDLCVALDEAILNFFRTYRHTLDDYGKMITHSPKVTINIYQVQNDYLNHFIRYGLELQDCGFHPDAVSILLENAMELFLERCEALKRDFLRLQLLYVKKALYLIYMDKGSYVDFTVTLASENLNLSEFYQYFADILDKRSDEVKYVYTSISSDI